MKRFQTKRTKNGDGKFQVGRQNLTACISQMKHLALFNNHLNQPDVNHGKYQCHD